MAWGHRAPRAHGLAERSGLGGAAIWRTRWVAEAERKRHNGTVCGRTQTITRNNRSTLLLWTAQRRFI
jgi:hypothetical protein